MKKLLNKLLLSLILSSLSFQVFSQDETSCTIDKVEEFNMDDCLSYISNMGEDPDDIDTIHLYFIEYYRSNFSQKIENSEKIKKEELDIIKSSLAAKNFLIDVNEILENHEYLKAKNLLDKAINLDRNQIFKKTTDSLEDKINEGIQSNADNAAKEKIELKLKLNKAEAKVTATEEKAKKDKAEAKKAKAKVTAAEEKAKKAKAEVTAAEEKVTAAEEKATAAEEKAKKYKDSLDKLSKDVAKINRNQ